MKKSRTISLPVLPSMNFGCLQVTEHIDGCFVISIISDEEVKSLLFPKSKDYQGKVITIGLTKKNSEKLKTFITESS